MKAPQGWPSSRRPGGRPSSLHVQRGVLTSASMSGLVRRALCRALVLTLVTWLPCVTATRAAYPHTLDTCRNNTCSTQKDIKCEIFKRSQFCMHRDESITDFPNSPRKLEVAQTQVGDYTYLNITWMAPHDYSYKAVKGYEVLVTDFYISRSITCFFVNLSATNWTAVHYNIHDVVFFLDCVRIRTSQFTKVHVKVFSYPKMNLQDHRQHDPNRKLRMVEVFVVPNSVPARNVTSRAPHLFHNQEMPTDVGKRLDQAESVSGFVVKVVVVVAFVVVAAAVVVVGCLWHRGYLRKMWFLGSCCVPRSSFTGPPIKVLQLYAAENEELIQLVRNHAALLARHLPLHVLDCGALRHTPNAQHWLQDHSAQRRVIVYVSPQLIHELRNAVDDVTAADAANEGPDDSMARACAQLIRKLTSPAALKKGRGRGRNPVFVLTGCFPSDEKDDQYLSGQPSLRGLTRLWLSKDQALTPPHPLLGKLSGFHRSFFTSPRDWSQDPEAGALHAAARQLHSAVCTNRCCLQLQLHQPEGGAASPRAGAREVGGAAVELTDAPPLYSHPPPHPPPQYHAPYPHVHYGKRGGAAGGGDSWGPRRTDSGFSSSDNPDSNPSSQGTNSPGARGGMDDLFVEEGEGGGGLETDPFLSASQTIFHPPDHSGLGDTDSDILLQMERVNQTGEARWC